MSNSEQQRATEESYGRPPAEGERSALIGLVPQYEVAAGLALRALTEETLEWIALLDPAAGRLDDFQLATPGRLDAYQIKWSSAGGQMSWSEIKSNLGDLLRDREGLVATNADRRVYGHLYTDQVASSTPFGKQPEGPENASPAKAVAELLGPATDGNFTSVEDIPADWRGLWVALAGDLGIEPAELLQRFGFIRLEFGRQRPTRTEVPGVDAERYHRDVRTLRSALFDAAVDESRPIRISRDELLDRLPSDWRTRLELLSAQEFTAPSHYEPIGATVDELTRAIDAHDTGYVALVGSPGSGKSTLLSQELRGRGDLVARYYAYVRGRGDLGSVRGDAAAFLHDLVLTLERGGLPRGPAPVDFDIPALTRRLERHLAELGARHAESGDRAIVMVDGLDHVEREIERDKSLLRYLPRPEALPPGVLFVVGSQSIKMLDAAIQVQLGEPGRTVTMQGLDRLATARVVDASGGGVDPGAVYETTRGHPLLVDYVLRELSEVDPAERAQHLAAMPPYGGDVTVLYERLWQDVAGDAELIELLALAARIRVAVDIVWLRDCGQSTGVVRRLREKLAHLFRRQGERWHFFHDSFRVFLQRRTTMADPSDDPDPAEDSRYHLELAGMCQATADPHPMSWEALFHLAAADEHRAVLDLATPAYFRGQTLALRPPELIAADIRIAARSLAVEQDPMALVKLAISAGELGQRGYHLPEREQLVDILFGTGRWETVVDLMDAERDGYGSDDSRTLRLRIAARLYRMGHAEEGRRLFEANEPLELLTGGDLTRPARGPYQLLYAWAEAAVLFRGPDAVIAAAGRIRIPPESVLGGGRHDEDHTNAVRAWMLARASYSADSSGVDAAADLLQAELDPNNDDPRIPWTWLLLQRAHGHDAAARLDALLAGVEAGQLDGDMRVLIADTLARHGRLDDARLWIEGLKQPPLSDAMSFENLWDAERERYRLARLRSRFGERPDPDTLVAAPEADYGWGYVHVARIVIAIAQLDGMAWAEETLTPTKFLAAAKPVFRRLAIRGPDWIVDSTLRRVRADAVAQLLSVAHEHGPAVAAALWEELERRWDESPSLLTLEGRRVLPVALAGGAVAGQDVRARFDELVETLGATTEAQEMARSLGETALTAISLGQPDEAWRLLERSVAASLAVYERKDYQLGSWIELLGPLLDSDGGAELARWLCGALAELRRDTGVVQANDAADPLLRGESRRRPGHAWRIGQWLEDELVVDRDDRQVWLLAGNISAADRELWWTVLADATVPIAAEPLGPELVAATRAAVASRGTGWVAERLRTVTERARVEGPPSSAAGWIEAVADAAVDCGIGLEHVGLAAEDHPDRRPRRTWMRGTGEDERDAFLAAHSTLDELTAGAEAAQADGKSSEWSEALGLLAPGLDRSGIERVLASAGERVDDLLTLAECSVEIGVNDVARELAERVLAIAEPRGWRRHYDGGSVLRAMMVLWRLDPGPTRDRAYRRFAADASTDQFLLSELSQDLTRYLDLFGVDDRLALAREIEAYVRVLVRDPSAVPAPDGPDDERSLDEVLAQSLADLLVSRHRLAVSTAQRALVAALRDGDESVAAAVLALALHGGDDEVALRILSVLETAAAGDVQLEDAVLDALEPWATADALAVRVAARELLVGAGRTPAELPERPLPASYKLVVSSPETPAGMEGHQPLGDDLASAAFVSAGDLRRLAEQAGVDLGLLEARVDLLARQLGGDERAANGDGRRESVLGWAVYPTPIFRWETAALRAAAELVDAGRINAQTALALTWGRLYDPALIGRRPNAQPDAVPRALAGQTRDRVTPDGWLDDLDDAESRLAREVGGWTVIAEQTDVRYLDRAMPRERRWQRIAASDDVAGARPPRLRPLRVAEFPGVRVGAGQAPVLEHGSLAYRGPSAWLALHPRLAMACGLRPCDADPLSYCDDDGVIRVRSFWWRRGWLDSARWTTHDEVGEGWLVLADATVWPALGKAMGDEMRIVWEVKRDFVAPDQSERRALRGVRSPREEQIGEAAAESSVAVQSADTDRR